MESNLIVFQLIMFQAETSATAPMNPESQMQQQLHQQNQQQQMQSKIFFRKLIFTYCNGCRVVVILTTLLCMTVFWECMKVSVVPWSQRTAQIGWEGFYTWHDSHKSHLLDCFDHFPRLLVYSAASVGRLAPHNLSSLADICSLMHILHLKSSAKRKI